jgi:hypothetical protein
MIGVMSNRLTWVVAGLLFVGCSLVGAGILELASDRNLPPGWTRYQPPWTWPAVVVGAVLVCLGLTTWAVARHRTRFGGPSQP